MLKLLAWDKKSLENDTPDHDFTSPENTNKHVVVVMDGMTEFTTEPLQWALDNVVTVECAVTLVGVMPWLNIPYGRIDMIKSKQKMIRNDDSSSREFSMLSSATPQLAVSEESRQDIK
ncbi:hypothetical protein RYX36_004290 [Vicia faba]